MILTILESKLYFLKGKTDARSTPHVVCSARDLVLRKIVKIVILDKKNSFELGNVTITSGYSELSPPQAKIFGD